MLECASDNELERNMHWITAFSHSTQAMRKQVPRPSRPALAELSRDLLGLAGLTVWVVAWIGLMLYLGV